MAESFRRYMQIESTPIIGSLIHLFRKVKNFIKDITGQEYVIDKLFYDINNGKYASINPSNVSSRQEVLREDEELATIKNKAIANGTFMKAPNGKPTHLDEHQWLQVRTKAFKDWFGDWEKGLTIKQDNKSYYRGQYDEPILDKDGNLILKGKKDSLYERAGYNIEKGVSATTDMKSADEYGINQRYAYEADIEDKYGELDQSWEKEQELNEVAEHGYYLIQFSKNISNKIINEAGEVKIIDDVVIPKGQYTIEHITDESIEILATSNNNASKVVDENGEPTVDAVTEYDLEKPIYEERKENNIEVKSATVFQPVNMLSLKLATLFPHINVLYNQDTNKIDINSLEDVTIFLTDDREADADAHEYALYYLHMFKDHPLVMAAIKLYGSMESLTKADGEKATE